MEMFKPITVEDREVISKYLSRSNPRACDYSLGNLILWSEIYHTQYAVDEDMLFIKFLSGDHDHFAYPLGDGDLKKAFAWLLAYAQKQNMAFIMDLVEPDMFEKIEKIFPGEFEIQYQRDRADYVYHVEDLKNLAGKKYHGKRNHIKKFIHANPGWTYEAISDENVSECIEMVKEWCKLNLCGDEEAKLEEYCVLTKGLEVRKALNLTGGIIRIPERIVALTLGERFGEDMFVIHFEKALVNIHGSYPMINQQFILHELSDCTYVNREEDMGIEGLRKAKESYYPAFMVAKGIVSY